MKTKNLVGVFDILGFSNLVKTEGIENVYSRMKSLFNPPAGHDTPHFLFASSNLFAHRKFWSPSADHYIFSDSIILFNKNSHHWSDFLPICNALLESGVMNNLPLRGAIAYGDVIVDFKNNIFLGDPIIDAYQLSENQNWVGASFHSSVCKIDETLGSVRIGSYQDQYQRCTIPLKKEPTSEVLPCALSSWLRGRNVERKLKELMACSPESAKIKYREALILYEIIQNIELSERMLWEEFKKPFHISN
jgi:hypothetical protein